MTQAWYLEAGTDGTDRLDLMSGASGTPGYTVVAGEFDIDDDAEDPARFQIITVPLVIKGESRHDLWNKRRAILTKLNQASFNRIPGSGQPDVTLAIRVGASSQLVRWVIESGELDRGSLSALPGNVLGGVQQPAMLRLRVYRGGMGEVVEYGPFTVTGADPTLFINGVPGDMPGVLEVEIDDETTNSLALNRLRWACRSLPSATDGDVDPVLPFNSNDDSVPDTFTGGIASISASSTWQTIGSVSREASVYDGGVFDVYCRLRDATAALGIPGAVEATGGENIALVQWRGGQFASGSSVSLTWDNPTEDGNFLALAVGINTDTTPNIPSGWSLAEAVTGNPGVRLFYKQNAASESGTVTVTFDSTASNPNMALMEFRGIATTGSLDVTDTNTETSATSASSGTTASTAQANALAIAVFMTSSGSLGTSPTVSSPWASVFSSSRFLAAGRVLTATGTQSVTATQDNETTQDWAALIAVFKGAEAVGASVPVNGYSVRVVAVDGSGGLSAPSEQATATLGVTGAIHTEWSAASGPVNQYRVYVRPDDGDWVYFETGSTATNFTITDLEDADGTEDPPAVSTISPGDFRLFVGRENSAIQQPPIGPFSASVANSEWEWVYVARVHLPPSSTPHTADATGFGMALQGRADTNVQLDADAILLLPADENTTMDVAYPPDSETTPRVWHVWGTPQGHTNGYLTDGSDEVANLRARGNAAIGPGDVTMVFVPSVGGGVSNVDDVDFDVTVRVRPRYEFLVGSP